MSILAIAGAIAGAVIADHRAKRGDGSGFIPDDTSWYGYASDWPAVWDSLARNELWQRTRPQLLPAVREAELSVYRAIGIRPTPARFRLYLGDRLLVSSIGDAYGCCVRPGIVVRTGIGITRWLTGASTRDVIRFRNLFLGTRDGFLIVSESRKFVEASLEGPSPGIDSTPALSCRFAVLDADGPQPIVELTLEPTAGLPVSGVLSADFPEDVAGAAMDLVSPIPALLFVSCGSLGHLEATAAAVRDLIPAHQSLERVQPFAERAAAAFFKGILPSRSIPVELRGRGLSIVCAGVPAESVVPVPAVAMRAPRVPGEQVHPLFPMLANLDPVPHEWNGVAGSAAPVLSDAFTLCLASTNDLWLAASTEPLMAELTAAPPPASASGPHLVVSVDWEKSADAFVDLARHWSGLGLVPEQDAATTGHRALAWADAVRSLRATELEGSFEDRTLRIRGLLNKDDAGST